MIKLSVTSDGSRTFTSQVGDTYYKFRTYYNRLDGWYVDIWDNDSNIIVEGVKLNVGIDLMRQFTGNDFGNELYYVTSDGSDGDGSEDLGDIGSVQCSTV